MKTSPPIIFLGPSLSIDEAMKILPNAIYFPPAKCGDILHAVKLAPECIVLIDGYFESTPAVWHKEILYALEKGIPVFGAASMGAIRAAELSTYGMTGVGQIFESFKNGTLEDDDEVAIAHHGYKLKYQAISLPFINIRASLKAALKKQLISPDDEIKLLNAGKNVHYKNRVWNKIFVTADIEIQKKNELIHFIKTDGYIDQKKLDTADTLLHVSKEIKQKKTLNTPRSLYFKGLLHFTSCEPFPYFTWRLPKTDQISCISKLTAPHNLLSKIAMLGSIASSLTESLEEKIHKMDALEHINILFKQADNSFLKERALASKLATIIITKAHEMELSPHLHHIQKFADNFRHQHKLYTKNTFTHWLTENNLSLIQFQNIMESGALIDYLAYRNNSDILQIKKQPELIDWYYWALKLTENNAIAESYLDDIKKRKLLLTNSFESFTKNKIDYLASHGFSSEEEFSHLIHCLSQPQGDAKMEK